MPLVIITKKCLVVTFFFIIFVPKLVFLFVSFELVFMQSILNLQTRVEAEKALFEVLPTDRILFVGSCFADNMGRRFTENRFRTVVNPYGVMYNPASILHTVARAAKDGTLPEEGVDVAVFTLGTNHVYILNETGEIVDNCQKRPQRLFTEKELTVGECADYLIRAYEILKGRNAEVKLIITVSPIRYQKYGFHGSQLSKATLQLAADQVVKSNDGSMSYFPAYEIMNDELRDYRFYQPDMLHPTEQAVDYIYERFKDALFSKEARQMEEEWQPIRKALTHRPFNPDSQEHRAFLLKTKENEKRFIEKWKL